MRHVLQPVSQHLCIYSGAALSVQVKVTLTLTLLASVTFWVMVSKIMHFVAQLCH